MTQKVMSLLGLTSQLQELKQKKQIAHNTLIETNRAFKRGEVTNEDVLAVKARIADLTSSIRSLEHDVSVLTVLVCQQATVEETPYGRTIKYNTGDTNENGTGN